MRGALGAVLVLVAVLPGAAAAQLRVTSVTPPAAVAGAVVEVRGSGLTKPVRVTVGGKRARVVAARGRLLRFGIPRAKPGRRTVVIRSAAGTVRRTLRILKPFRGKVGVRIEKGRATTATIGREGGQLQAHGSDGTRFALVIPANAVLSPTAITMTPVGAFTGLPLSGGKSAIGVQLKPDGLEFATPATLTITARHALPRRTVGFSHSGKAGFDAQSPKRSGRVLTLKVAHFSSTGLSPTQAADFANAIQPIINSTGTLSVNQVEELLNLIAAWEDMFAQPNASPPVFFCADLQPVVCGAAKDKALTSMNTRLTQACASGRASPSLRAVRDLIEIEGVRAQLGAETATSGPCQLEIFSAIVAAAKQAAAADPLSRAVHTGELRTAEQLHDLDGDGSMSQIEWLFLLASVGQPADLEPAATDAQLVAQGAMAQLATDGPAGCNADQAAGEARVRTGLAYATALQFLQREFITALDGCLLAVTVAPANATVAPGATQQFAQTVAPLADPGNDGVTWSASGGSIDQHGLFTAPGTPGSFTVTATSTVNPARSGTATINVLDCIQITDGFGNSFNNAGHDFQTISLQVVYASGTIKLSRHCDGTGNFAVNDGLEIDFTRPNGSTASFSRDFSGGCSGSIGDQAPTDVTSDFGVGTNSVTAHFKDICGQGGSSTTGLFFVYGP